MDQFIARSEYRPLSRPLESRSSRPRKARDLVKLLIVEEDKPSQDQEQLELAERRAAKAPNEDELPTLGRLLL